ncbi:MAG: monovalent cation:proton antiporter-2 (CPA2) family protein [Gammaproteobacteria bacterium]|nr:monovalent cation:proton antiporter-2 (CPA2) family protein [Gammaproteobacteria bacterium]NND61075.1 glutathione-regulated potassium-efflux system protein KefB [Gammaproteobacteria bacterium]
MSMLEQAVLFLAAATLVVPLSKRLGFGSVIGYLAAGVAIAPFVSDVDGILHFAEIGVVMLLFVIGLELQPARLRLLRKSVFGIGMVQVLVTGAALTVIAHAFIDNWSASILIGYALSLSSTAFVLQMLAEKKDLRSRSGRAAFGVLLFQDIAVIPLIALIPYLGDTAIDLDGPSPLVGLLTATLTLAVFVVGGRYLLRPILRLVAAAQIQEIFTAATLLLVLGSAVLMEHLGLSMGLGAFLAGVLVADSEYSFQLESDIQPFKGLLLGLFFVAIGMSANLGLLLTEPTTIIAITAGLMALKTVALIPIGRINGLSTRDSLKLGLVLSQGGEFAFVLFTLGLSQGVLDPTLTEKLVLAVTLSMALTPILYLLNERFSSRLIEAEPPRPFDEIEETDHEVIIAGFGRFGQIVARILTMKKIPFTALESSSDQVDFVRRFGNKIYYGDASQVELLRSAHVDKAKVFVLAVDDVDESMRIARTVRQNFPNVAIFARARNRQHCFALMDLGITTLIRDTFLSSIELSRDLLIHLGRSPERANASVAMFRKHDEETLLRQHAIHHNEEALIQSARESAAQLSRLFEADAGASDEPAPVKSTDQ